MLSKTSKLIIPRIYQDPHEDKKYLIGLHLKDLELLYRHLKQEADTEFTRFRLMHQIHIILGITFTTNKQMELILPS